MATIYKISLIAITAILFRAQPSLAQASLAQHQKFGLTWNTDVMKAYELSKTSEKPVFAFFTGSDWCGWCHKLERAVFEKPGFQAWAKKNVVLLELDYPRNTQQPEALVKQNEGLQNFFQVQGFPTIWIFNMDKDSTGKFNIAPLGSFGYPRAEPGKEEAVFLKTANDVLNNKSKGKS